MKRTSIFSVVFILLISNLCSVADPIHDWAKLGKLDKIKQFEQMQAKQKKQIDWDAKNQAGQTVLMFASAGGHDQIVIYLLERSANPAITDRERKTAFDYAKNDLIKTALIKRSKTKDGQTLLTQTIKNGDEHHFETLIAHSATDINQPNVQGQTPLHVGVLQDNKTESNKNIIKKLLTLCNITVDAQDQLGNTPLHYASMQGNVELVMALAGAGAQATIANKDGKKPSQLIGKKSKSMNAHEKAAIETGLKALEENPVDIKKAKQHCIAPAAGQGAAAGAGAGAKVVRMENDEEQTPAQARKQQELAALTHFDANTGQTLLTAAACEGSLKNTMTIIQMGALVNAPDQNVETPLLAAVKCYRMPVNGINHFAVIDYLLKQGASILIHDKDGKNPLHYAVEHENDPVVMLLLASLVNNPNKTEIINAQDKNGDTPLHYAAATSSFHLIRNLLIHGADRDIKNNAGQYPRDILGSKQSTSSNNRQNIDKNSQEIRQLLGIEISPNQSSAAAAGAGAGAASSRPTAKLNGRAVSQIPIQSQITQNNELSTQSRGRASSVLVKPTSQATPLTENVDYKTPKKLLGKPGIVTFDDETGDTHIEIPADDESDSDR